jgi:hypothetical protein
MRIKAVIEFEVEKTLIQKANYGIHEMDEQTIKTVWRAREDIFHQLVEDLRVAETTTNYSEVMNNTSIKDFKFFVVHEEPLLFEL